MTTLREPRCILNHDAARRKLRETHQPATACVDCGWLLTPARDMLVTESLDNGELLDTLVEVSEFIDNYVDVVDGDYGEPQANRAMNLQARVDACIQTLERLQS